MPLFWSEQNEHSTEHGVSEPYILHHSCSLRDTCLPQLDTAQLASDTRLSSDSASVPQPMSTNVPHRRTVRRDHALTCPHEGCTHKGTFPRKYELDRHVQVKHQGRNPFSCPVNGCFRGLRPSSFPRPDNLTAHIRDVHHRQPEQRIRCSAHGCTKPPMELDLLGVHIKQSHDRLLKINGTLRAIAHAASSAYLHCPLWNCPKTMPLRSMIKHLLSHPRVELELIEEELLSLNYELEREQTPGASEFEETGAYPQIGAIVAVRVVCPICKYSCNDHAAFENHMDETHLVGKQQSHFQHWRDYARSRNGWKISEKFKPWTYWEPQTERDACGPFRCPSCDFRTRVWVCATKHHIGMLADSEKIRPYRREILKLYPDFATHPVWNDMA